jgi:hypothetical protein
MFFASGGSPSLGACASADAVINAINPAAVHAVAPCAWRIEMIRCIVFLPVCCFDFGPRQARGQGASDRRALPRP